MGKVLHLIIAANGDNTLIDSNGGKLLAPIVLGANNNGDDNDNNNNNNDNKDVAETNNDEWKEVGRCHGSS